MNKSFYEILEKLKHIKRQGWVDRGLEADTIASHIFAAMNIGCELAMEEGLNESRIVELLLVHDLVMAEMEDITPQSGKYANKSEMEKDAKLRVADKLLGDSKTKYLSLFDEFQQLVTPESQVAREADKLETLLQGERYEEKIGRNDILDEFLITYKDVFKTASGKRLYDEIVERHAKRKEVIINE